jgi:hypothetical protein
MTLDFNQSLRFSSYAKGKMIEGSDYLALGTQPKFVAMLGHRKQSPLKHNSIL